MALKDESYYRAVATTMRVKAEDVCDPDEQRVFRSIAEQYDTLARMASLSPTRTLRTRWRQR